MTELTVEDVNTTAIQLTWLRQSDHKPSYSYLVIAFQDARVLKNYSTKNETYTFVDLSPGELYTFDVFTVVEGVRSTVESISTHTSTSSKLLKCDFMYKTLSLSVAPPKEISKRHVLTENLITFIDCAITHPKLAIF